MAFQTALDGAVYNEFSITADLSKYGIGEVEVVNGQALETYGEKLRFWIGGLIIFFTVAFLWRKGSTALGSGKGG